MKYMVDIDGTICTTTINSNYIYAEPFVSRIKHFNDLYDQVHEIHYWTARGGNSGKDWSEVTKDQFLKWNVKYTSLNFKKPSYDIWIDDKAQHVDSYFNDINNRK
jgi:hypothetical protein